MKKLSKLVSLTLLATLFVGCSKAPEVVVDAGAVKDPVAVVTSFYPLAFIAEQVAGERAQVVNLAGSQDIHDYRLTPQDLVKLNKADLVVVQGEILEPWAADLINQVGEKTYLLEMMNAFEKEVIKVEHHDEDGHVDEHGHDHGGEGFDPHIWLDPELAQKMVDEIEVALVKIDPEGSNEFADHAEKLKQKLVALDQKYQKELATCERKEVILSHNAFGYLAKRYGFTVHSIAGLSTQDEPSAQVLAALKAEAAEGISHVLVEDNNVQDFAKVLADETGLAVLKVNPLGRGPLDFGDDFFGVMENNLVSLKTALGCQ